MKALTVQQPWAWAIVHGGKPIDNRTQKWGYRGPLAIHAGQRIDRDALESDLINDAWCDRYGWGPASNGLFQTGVILGVVDMVGSHWEHPHCCDGIAWAEHQDRPMMPVEERRPIAHLEVENPRSLGFLGENMITAKGRLGLWTPEPHVVDRIQTSLAVLAAVA